MPIEKVEGDALIRIYETAQKMVREAVFPALIEEEVTDDRETFMALRCPRCGQLVDELYAVSPAEAWSPSEDVDSDDAFDRRRITFDPSERPDLEETLYYKHDEHAVALPDGWVEVWS